MTVFGALRSEKLGKMTERNAHEIGKAAQPGETPKIDTRLRDQAQMLKDGFSPEAAGIVRDNATPEQRTQLRQIMEAARKDLQALGLRVEAFDADSVTLRLPQNDQLSRVGGMLCGQAMMAAADTAMVLALINQFGEFRPCTTVQMNTSFLKPLSGQAALVQARARRPWA